MPDDEEVQKLLREAIAEMPATIESGLLNPKASASSRLNWVKLAMRLLQDPTDRPITDIDTENKGKAAQLLKAAVPALEKIRDEHQSARLRSTAAQYLLFIANKVG
jgi:hypothetical protein